MELRINRVRINRSWPVLKTADRDGLNSDESFVENHPKPDFYEDFADLDFDGLVFHNGADLALGIVSILL